MPDTLDVCVGVDRVERSVTYERLELRGCDFCGKKLDGCSCAVKTQANA